MIVTIPAAKRRNMISPEFLQNTIVNLYGKEHHQSTTSYGGLMEGLGMNGTESIGGEV